MFGLSKNSEKHNIFDFKQKVTISMNQPLLSSFHHKRCIWYGQGAWERLLRDSFIENLLDLSNQSIRIRLAT